MTAVRRRGMLPFYAAAAGYLVIAGILMLGLKVVPADSLGRVAIAERVLFSRDPHLAAIGFVWNPLQILPLVPLVALKVIWPDLARLGFAAAIVSALFMAGAVYQVNAIFRDFGLGRPERLVLTVLFAVHPMILYYGANGMSEATLIFFLLLAVRHLAAWLRSFETPSLVYAGLALGGSYLVRYEALAPASAAILLVCVVSFMRSRGQRERLAMAVSDALIVGMPVIAAFSFWALASWLIVGHPFEPLTSTYGNGAYVHVIQQQSVPAAVEYSRGLVPAASIALRRMLILEPFLLILLFAAAVQVVRKRAENLLAPLTVFGAVLAFMLAAYLRGVLIGDLRYFIAVIPAVTLLIGAILPKQQPGRSISEAAAHRRPKRWRSAVMAGTVSLLGMAALAMPVAAAGMSDRLLAPTQSDELTPVIGLAQHPASRLAPRQRNITERAVAKAIDSLHPGSGKVLIDVVVGYAIVLFSNDPSQFVIPSDRDWRVALSDPPADGIEYVLVPQPTKALAALDEVNRTYPGVFQTGAGLGQLVESFDGIGDSPTWRLYRITSHPSGGTG